MKNQKMDDGKKISTEKKTKQTQQRKTLHEKLRNKTERNHLGEELYEDNKKFH